ncbi:metallophosphoesterase [Geminisphaera colitermitum]|uniref:metallophosphoesterase n=1 Tax=Geminisphaera colitermitum TaxID=1148786 RepID=UPI000158C69A|nr:metallophosphoesterase [Geminisphaera colitermitum]
MRSHFPLILTAYLLLCVWLGFRSWQALPRRRWVRNLWPAFIAVLTLSFMAGLALRAAGLWEPLARLCRLVGGMWLVTLPWWCIIAFIFEIVRLAARFRPALLPARLRANPQRTRGLALAGSIALVVIVIVYGYINFVNPQTTRVTVVIDKPAPPLQTLHAVFLADIHAGDIIGRKRTADYVRRINALNPDIILISGDILDNGLASLIEQNVGGELQKLHAPLGVYAVLGNHETYSDADASAAYFSRHGIRILRDEVVPMAGGAFYLAGREDASRSNRKTIPQLLAMPPVGPASAAAIDRTRPLILLDHQPKDLVASAAAGVDLQLSGHTHHGQVWPISWIVEYTHEVAYGYARRGDFQIYVTSGLGLWGLPARVGTVSEIVDLQIKFRTP